jgi:hemerythrin-like domain-containing protein
MHQAIKTLMHEHRIIEQVIASMLSFVDCIGLDDRNVVARYAEFLSRFADTCHHGKEEDRLFVRMTEHGFPSRSGPIAVMLSDHNQGRAHVRALVEIGKGAGPLTDDEIGSVADHAAAYADLLRAHIQKEDNILYPMALQSIPAEEMEQLAEQFEAFERDVLGEAEHARLHAIANLLIAEYPPQVDDGRQLCAGCM